MFLRVARGALAISLGMTVGLHSQAATIEVPAESATIQEAIAFAANGDVIEVSPGTYFGLIDTLGKAIELRSTDGPEVTILSGSGVGRVIQTANGEGPDTIIDGFTVTNGNMTWGAGMLNYVGSHPTVRNCIFEGNTGQYGAGMANYEGSNPVVENCIFRNNNAIHGAGMNNFFSSPVVRDCVFENNIASDPAIYTEGGGAAGRESAAVFIRCEFLNNHSQGTGGGLHSRNNTVNTLIDCVFVGNTTETSDGGAIGTSTGSTVHAYNSRFIANNGHRFGGGISLSPFADVEATFVNCEFIANHNNMFSGGAIYANALDVMILNCTFVDNTGSSASGGGIAFSGESGSLTVRNSVFRGNRSGGGSLYEERSQLSVNLLVPQSVSNSCIDQLDTLAGSGNFDADPMFVDADGADDQVGTKDDDVRLGAGSPCIDAGDNSMLPADVADLDSDADVMELLPIDAVGNARRFDDPDTVDTGIGDAPIVDIGAYEFTIETPACPADLNMDGFVNGADLATLLSGWGGSGAADLNGDGIVNGADLATMLSAWGNCPA